MNTHFDCWELEQIRKLVKSNPYLAKNKYEEYLQTFSDDYIAHLSYANCLTILGYADESDKYLNLCLEIVENNPKLLSTLKKVKAVKIECYYTYLKNLAYRCEYKKLYESLISNANRFTELINLSNSKRKRAINEMFCFSKILSGNGENSIADRDSYKENQIVDYQEERFYEHIQKHLKLYLSEYDISNASVFNVDFPVKNVVEEAKKYLQSSDKIYNFFADEYYFRYDGCGEVGGKKTDYFKIVVLHNTDKLITMYPTTQGKELHHIDLSYLGLKDVPTRKLSQIDKFNMRYKR